MRRPSKTTRTARKNRLTPRQVKQFRHAQEWSATELGRELGGYSRSYVKSIEGGSLPTTPRFVKRFDELRRRIIGERVRSRDYVSRWTLPKRLIIASKPRKCAVCHWYFTPRVPNQKYCGESCVRARRERSV